MYSLEIFTAKQVAPLRQYHLAYTSGHWKIWCSTFGLGVVVVVVVVDVVDEICGDFVDGWGRDTVRLEQASVERERGKCWICINLIAKWENVR